MFRPKPGMILGLMPHDNRIVGAIYLGCLVKNHDGLIDRNWIAFLLRQLFGKLNDFHLEAENLFHSSEVKPLACEFLDTYQQLDV